MQYYLGIVSNENNLLINNCINLHYFYTNYNYGTDLTKLNEIKYLLNGELYGSYDSLFDTFISNNYIDGYDFNKIIYFFICIFKLFYSNKKINEKLNYNYNALKSNKLSDDIFNSKLLIRTGIIELRAVNAFLYGDKELIKSAIINILNNYNDSYMYKQNCNCHVTIGHNKEDYEVYIKGLMTNAGFYIDNNSDNAYNDAYDNLEFFCNEYKKSIIECDYLMIWNFLNCYSLNILNEKKLKDNIRFFDYDETELIYNFLENKSILFLTPFKDKVDKVYESGNIYKLRKNKNFKKIDLTTLEAFLTTYPNKKHTCFKETYLYYCKIIDDEFKNKKFDVFTCSVGCYGLLLCNYVKTKYSITSFYVGHVINFIFGIISERHKGDNTINEEFYENSDLNKKYSNIEKIENNCYG